jgi:hypothetical protein
VQTPVLGSPWIFDVQIDGRTYHLPSPDMPPATILLADGSTVQLYSDKVVMRGQTLQIPNDLSEQQEISSGGQTIKTGPAKSITPPEDNDDDNGGGGGGGLFGFFGGIAKSAGSAVSGVANVGTAATSFVSSTGSASAGALAGTMTGAVGNIDSVVSSLNGVQSTATNKLTGQAADVFNSAQNLGRGLSNWLTSTAATLQNFDQLTPDVQKKVKDSIQEFTKKGGELDRAVDALNSFEEFLWEDLELPEVSASLTSGVSGTKTSMASTQSPDATTMSTDATKTTQSTSTAVSTTASQSTTTGSTSTSSTSTETPTPTADPTIYFITTKHGTPLKTFRKFIEDLDGSSGNITTNELDSSQGYIAHNVTASQAAVVKQLDFIWTIFPWVSYPGMEDEIDEFLAFPRHTSIGVQPHQKGVSPDYTAEQTEVATPKATDNSSLKRRAMTPSNPASPYWRKMMAQAPPKTPGGNPPKVEYLYDDSGGRGTTMYVVDDGFDLSVNVIHLSIYLVSD